MHSSEEHQLKMLNVFIGYLQNFCYFFIKQSREYHKFYESHLSNEILK